MAEAGASRPKIGERLPWSRVPCPPLGIRNGAPSPTLRYGLPSDQLAQRAWLTGSVGLSVVAATAWLRPWFLAMLRAWSAASSRA